jgi:hypothetical protein
MVRSVIAQLAPDKSPAPELIRHLQAWRDDYPWLQRAIEQIGPGARRASDGWRVRIEEELKTTLDFKLRPDGTAAVWCGMSGYDFHHDPTPKELFQGLGEAYRRERKRVSGNNPWKVSTSLRTALPERPAPQPLVSRFPQPLVEGSLTRNVGTVLLSHVEKLALIYLSVTELTLVFASVAIAVH